MEFNVNKGFVFTIKIPDEVIEVLLVVVDNELVMVIAVDEPVVVELLIVVVVEITVKLPVRLVPILSNISETSAITCKVYVTTVFGSNPNTMN